MFKSAFHYDSENGTGLNINMTFRNMLIPYSRFVIEGDIATSPRVKANYLVYLGKRQNKFLSLNSHWAKVDLPLYNDDGNKTSLWSSHQFNVNAQLNYTVGANFLFGGESGISWIQLKPEINEGTLKGISFIQETVPYLRVNLIYNTLNKKFFPTKGIKLKGEATYTNAIITNLIYKDSTGTFQNKSYNAQINLNIEYQQVTPINKKLVLHWSSNIVLTGSESENFSLNHFVGGFNPLYFNTISFMGAKPYEYRVSNVFITQLEARWEFFNKTYLTTSLNYVESEFPFKYIPNQNTTNLLGGLPRRFSFGVTLAYDSPLGPISFAIARDINKSQFTSNFSIGFWYK